MPADKKTKPVGQSTDQAEATSPNTGGELRVEAGIKDEKPFIVVYLDEANCSNIGEKLQSVSDALTKFHSTMFKYMQETVRNNPWAHATAPLDKSRVAVSAPAQSTVPATPAVQPESAPVAPVTKALPTAPVAPTTPAKEVAASVPPVTPSSPVSSDAKSVSEKPVETPSAEAGDTTTPESQAVDTTKEPEVSAPSTTDTPSQEPTVSSEKGSVETPAPATTSAPVNSGDVDKNPINNNPVISYEDLPF